MNDRKLLEAAAKAAGYQWRWFGANFCIEGNPTIRTFKVWNPLTDDGDALRLAVKLRMHISHYQGGTVTAGQWGRERREDCSREGEDYSAATRRAVVRAAAEIGGTA